MTREPVLVPTDHGLYCAAGGFHVDPWSPVERAIITHGHADHARPGSAAYLAAAPGETILRSRLGTNAKIRPLAYGERVTIGDASVSLHPAGHVLGSAQIRIERDGEVWVVSGDYATHSNPTCAAFEPVPCNVFVSECTFGLPIYRWPDPADVHAEINAWWRENQTSGRTSLLYAYSLGKAQRVIAGLDPSIGPIVAHESVQRLTNAYVRAGVALPPCSVADPPAVRALGGTAIVVAPPGIASSGWERRLGPVSSAFVSGWMMIRGARRRRAVQRGFVLSDHADWPGLNAAIEATGASRVIVTHGYTDVMSRWLTERGFETGVFASRWSSTGEGDGEADTDTDTDGDPVDAEARTEVTDGLD